MQRFFEPKFFVAQFRNLDAHVPQKLLTLLRLVQDPLYGLVFDMLQNTTVVRFRPLIAAIPK